MLWYGMPENAFSPIPRVSLLASLLNDAGAMLLVFLLGYPHLISSARFPGNMHGSKAYLVESAQTGKNATTDP